MPDFSKQRKKMVDRYRKIGYISSEAMASAVHSVPREQFMNPDYKDYSYLDQPFPIPGDGRQTISAPYMYPIFYEPLKLKSGDSVLEVGAGSGYGAALSKELVGKEGTVVSIEINPITYQFARENLERTGYGNVILILGDGALGYPENAPYDAVCITAACPEIPEPLVSQLRAPGKLMAPVGRSRSVYGQDLILLEKGETGMIVKKNLMKVSYVPLTGRYGTKGD